MKRVVFDLDETICRHTNRDYANAAPVWLTIERMRQLRERFPECEIVIHTARGMKSCGGDVEKADAKNRAVTEDWLERHNVPYDILVFGKPFADAYIDDKAITLEEWQQYGASCIGGGYSGKKVARVGRIVVKDDGGAQRDWYARAAELRLCSVCLPTVISWSFNRLFLRYVDGHPLSSSPDGEVSDCLPRCAAAVREMGSRDIDGENDVLEYARLVGERATLAKMDERRLGELLDRLYALRVLRRRTFCHGDFTPQNIIRSDDGSRLYLIDPSFKQCYSTYLLDAAKFRACLRGMTRALDGTCDYQYPKSLAFWDSLWTPDEAEAVRVLERTHLVRVAGLARQKGDGLVADALLRMEGEA